MKKLLIYLQHNAYSLIILILSICFYLFFAIYDGPVIAVDSPGYINMSFSREPFYPMLLAFFRQFHPEEYLFYVVIFQSLLMAFCGWILADFLVKNFCLSKRYGMILYFLPIAVSLMNRFLAKRSSMYTNSILTEGICTSLYLLFIYFLMSFIFTPSRKKIITAWAIMFLMFSSRKQMIMTLPIFAFVLLYDACLKKNIRKGLLTILLSSLLLVGSFSLFDCTYNYILRGSFEGHSSSNRFISTMVFYNSKPSDADYIEDPHIKELFLSIYKVCDENGYIASHAGTAWLERVHHFGDHYDHIQINTMWPMILENSREIINEEYANMNLSEDKLVPLYDKKTDEINSIIIRSILPHQLPQLIKVLFDNFLSGIVITISQLRSIFIPYTIIMFFLYFCFTAFLIKKEISSNLSQDEHIITQGSILLSAITIIGIITNVLLVSSVIFCQTRYTIYNMPLFYMTICVLFYQCVRLFLGKRANNRLEIN